jgi:hypothetical protein
MMLEVIAALQDRIDELALRVEANEHRHWLTKRKRGDRFICLPPLAIYRAEPCLGQPNQF